MRIFLVRAIDEADRDDDGNPLWWSDSGWTSLAAAQTYSQEVRDTFRPPLGGEWVLFMEVTPAGISPLDQIHALLDGTEWGSDTMSRVATVLTDAGYTIRDPEGD